MDSYAKRFLELLRYVPYLKDEKARIQCSLSGLPQSYHDRIEFENPKTLDDTIRKEKFCYDKFKDMQEPPKDWKIMDMPIFQRKGFKSSQYKNSKKGSQFVHLSISMHQQNFSSWSGNRPVEETREKV